MMHYPKSREEWLALRHQYISSTEVAALFGMSPYSTAFEMAVLKKQADPDPDREGSERMIWGLRQQHVIAKGVEKDYGVKVRAVSGYATYSHLASKMGASFDYEIVGLVDGYAGSEASLRDMYTQHGAGILECKNVDYFIFKEWKTDEGIEPPGHIELQVQHQLACIARPWAAIAALIGGNKLEVVIRERDHEVEKAIAKKCAAFWRTLDEGKMPPVDLPADAEIIAKLYRYAEPGKVVDAQADDEMRAICADYAAAAKAIKEATAIKETAKAKLLMKIGDAEKVLVNGFSISAGVVAETDIAYKREAYRNLRVTVKSAAKSAVIKEKQSE